VTSKRLCFFSMFNQSDLVLSDATKLTIPFAEIIAIEKCKTAKIFDSGIKFTCLSQGVVKFLNFYKRDTSFNLIYEMVSGYFQGISDEIMGNAQDPNDGSQYRNDEEVKEEEIKVYDEDVSSFDQDGFQFDHEIIEKVQAITTKNSNSLSQLDEEFLDENLNQYETKIVENYQGVDLRKFYYLIYGDYLFDNGQTFLANYAEKSGSTDIIDHERESAIPQYFQNYKANERDYLGESVLKQFNNTQQSVKSIEYNYELMFMNMKQECHVNSKITSFFVSPFKIVIISSFKSTGSQYSEFFTPMTITILEQIVDEDSKSISVKQTIKFFIKFHKPIMFFQSMIKTLSQKKLHENMEKIMVPMIVDALKAE